MEAIGTLAGGVAHDLNNILAGLVSYPELLLMQLPDDSPLRKPLTTMKKSGEKASTIVRDLLTLARRGVANMEVSNFNRIVREYLTSPEYEKLQVYHPNVTVETNLEFGLAQYHRFTRPSFQDDHESRLQRRGSHARRRNHPCDHGQHAHR